MLDTYREGVIVRSPFERLTKDEIQAIDKASKHILEEIGILCYNEEALDIFIKNKCRVIKYDDHSHRVKIPADIVTNALASVPSKITLGARDKRNSLVLDAEVPRVYFGSGSETNIWLDTDLDTFVSEKDPTIKRQLPIFTEKRGTVERLVTAARLAQQLEHLDFFIRPVNIQDEDITKDNHDVNKFYASLSALTKHVQAGLTNIEQLDNVILLAELIAGGKEALKENPLISFITCTIKSPLQMVKDATQKLIEIVKRGMPLVISSSPQGGSTAPYHEAGMVAQINAELLAGITLSQIINPGSPVIYGSVPVRARMDNLHDMYGAPEFNHYNIDCIQMARFYKIPCYSTAGVGDSRIPGIQATVEKLFTQLPIPMAGAHYIHYAFGLLDRTNIFCPLQAVLDNQHIGMIKSFLASPQFGNESIDKAVEQIQRVMESKQRLYVRFVRSSLREGRVYLSYAFESKAREDKVMENALHHMDTLLSKPMHVLPPDTEQEIFMKVPGLVSRLRNKNSYEH
ncbi:MAG: trimethylamine methyltransferase family protein [bacterium]